MSISSLRKLKQAFAQVTRSWPPLDNRLITVAADRLGLDKVYSCDVVSRVSISPPQDFSLHHQLNIAFFFQSSYPPAALIGLCTLSFR